MEKVFGADFDDAVRYAAVGSTFYTDINSSYQLVVDTIVGTSRWSYQREVVVYREGDSTHWRRIFEEPATEMQEGSFDDDEPGVWVQVRKGEPIAWKWEMA